MAKNRNGLEVEIKIKKICKEGLKSNLTASIERQDGINLFAIIHKWLALYLQIYLKESKTHE